VSSISLLMTMARENLTKTYCQKSLKILVSILSSSKHHTIVGKSVTFTVEIDWAKDLPLDLCKNVFVKYGLQFEKSKVLTPETQGKDRNPQFNFKRVH